MVATGTAAVVFLLLAAFVAWPLVQVLVVSVWGPEGPPLLPILLNSLLVSAISTALIVLLALGLAYAATRTTLPGRRFLSLTSRLPLISPPFFASLALILLFGKDGAMSRSLGPDWSIYGFHGIVIAQVLTFLPQAYILLANVLGGIDSSLEEAAENLGAGSLTILRRVTLSLARPGLASAALSVFVLCMTDFGNPLLVGGRDTVLATAIYAQAVRRHDFVAAATLSAVLLVPCLAACLLSACGAGPRSAVQAPAGARAAPRPTPGLVRWPLFVLSGGATLCVAVVFGLVPLGSVVRVWGSDWSLSLDHYGFTATAEGAWPIWNSVELALIAAGLGTVLALLAAYVIERKRPPGARVIEFLSLLPAALPGTVIGVGYILAFNAPPLLLRDTLWILVASVVFWRFPAAVLAASDAFRRIDPAVEEAAVNLGAGSVRTFARMVLPLLTGTALSVFVDFFIGGMVTVSAVIFLVSPGFSLGSVAILGQVEQGSLGTACALGTSLLAIVIGSVLLLRALPGGGGLSVLKSGSPRSAL